MFKNVRILGTRFTNAISCFKPGPQEPYREIFLEKFIAEEFKTPM
jgi:hypothetical protein